MAGCGDHFVTVLNAKLADKRFGDVFDILVIGVHQHGPIQLPPYEVVVGL